jgi:hypothetical protein
VVVGCLLATAMVVVAVTPIADPDVWWVAAAGREMLAGHGISVPRANVFSFVEPSHPWVMHEWLFGIPYASGLAHFGPAFYSAIALAVMAIELALLAGGTIGRARHSAVGLIVLAAAVGFFGGRFLSARPTGVAMVFPIAITLVAFAPRFGVGSILLATILELGWTNAHGSFPLGVVLVLVAAIERREGRARALRLVTATTMGLATLVNPYGLALHRFVWGYFRGSEGVYRLINLHIREFGSFPRAWGATVGPSELVGLALFVALAAGAARDRRYRARALFCLGMFALAVLHARHFELAGLLSCLLLLPYFDDLATPLFERFSLPAATMSRRAAFALVLAPACAIALGAFLVTCSRRAANEGEWIQGGPPLVRAISALPADANVVVPFTTAGVVLWYAFPRGVRVLFDSRNDCYSAETFAAFWSLETTTTPDDERARILYATNADAALVPEGHPLVPLLARSPDWTLTRSEGAWRVFLRHR